MPTLEDTAVDFPVTTLNDLLEVEAKAGVPVGADEDKYRRWAFLSTGAAGLLAIILVVVLLTGGSDKGGSDGTKAQTSSKPPGTSEVPLTISESRLGGGKAGEFFKVTSAETGAVLAKAGKLTSFKKGTKLGGVQQVDILLAVSPDEETALNTTSPGSLRFNKVDEPPAGQPAQTPAAPTPEAPVPETPASTQPNG